MTRVAQHAELCPCGQAPGGQQCDEISVTVHCADHALRAGWQIAQRALIFCCGWMRVLIHNAIASFKMCPMLPDAWHKPVTRPARIFLIAGQLRLQQLVFQGSTHRVQRR